MQKTVLAVDDSRTIRNMLAFTLKQAGYKVLQAENGAEAVAMLGCVDCVVTDLTMPQMDGIELIRHIRADANHKQLPIVMLTVEGEDIKRQTGRGAGASTWVAKPFKPDQLVASVRKACG